MEAFWSATHTSFCVSVLPWSRSSPTIWGLITHKGNILLLLPLCKKTQFRLSLGKLAEILHFGPVHHWPASLFPQFLRISLSLSLSITLHSEYILQEVAKKNWYLNLYTDIDTDIDAGLDTATMLNMYRYISCAIIISSWTDLGRKRVPSYIMAEETDAPQLFT